MPNYLIDLTMVIIFLITSVRIGIYLFSKKFRRNVNNHPRRNLAYMCIGVFSALFIADTMIIRDSKIGGFKGMIDAKVDFASGKLRIESYGLASGWSRDYKLILKEKYGIEHDSVAGCLVSPWITGHAKAYNKEMKEKIKERYGDSIFEDSIEEARHDFELRLKRREDDKIVNQLQSHRPYLQNDTEGKAGSS